MESHLAALHFKPQLLLVELMNRLIAESESSTPLSPPPSPPPLPLIEYLVAPQSEFAQLTHLREKEIIGAIVADLA